MKMNSIVNEFVFLNKLPENIKKTIELIHVWEDLAICMTHNQEVYAVFDSIYFGKNYSIISELCYQNIDQFFRFQTVDNSDGYLLAKSKDKKLFSSGSNKHGQLGRGFKSDNSLGPQRINFLDGIDIIDISGCSSHCLALTSQGLVYGWGEGIRKHFKQSEFLEEFLTPVLINSEFGVEKRVKHIYSSSTTSFLVSFDGEIYFLNPLTWHSKIKISTSFDVYKIYSSHQDNLIVLNKSGFLDFYQKLNDDNESDLKQFEISLEDLAHSNFIRNELLITRNNELEKFNLSYGQFSPIKDRKIFEYCLFDLQITLTNIYFKNDRLYYNDFEFNEDCVNQLKEEDNLYEMPVNFLIFKSINDVEIFFNLDEYQDKFHNPIVSKSIENFDIFKIFHEITHCKIEFYHQMKEKTTKTNNAIFVMDNNDVYGIGKNENGILGLGHQRDVNKITIIHSLCNENIEEFFEGKSCVFARSSDKQIYCWGSNENRQLDFYNKESEILKPSKIEFFENKNIIEISCGDRHCLALSGKGEIYGWGGNDFGQTGSIIESDMIFKPIEMISIDKVKFINCCGDISCAVTVDGRAFIWGEVNGIKTHNPQHILSDIYKIYLNCELNKPTYYSILTDEKIFKFYKNNEPGPLFECNNVNNLFQENVIEKEDVIHKIDGIKKTIERTNYSNFYEYFLYEKSKIIETIHITSDGYIMQPIIEMIKNSKEIILKKTFKNIYDKKYENSFNQIGLEPIGTGYHTKVFKVEKKSNNKLYAIKMMQIECDLAKKLREIKIMSQLSEDKSEYFVEYYNSWTEAQVVFNNIENYVFIQMELCSQNLNSIIETINELDDKKFKTIKYFIRIELLCDIIECLCVLHSKSIIHRDLWPKNILITDGINKRFVKLCDFGLSKVYENSENTRDVGHINYCAPEVRRGEKYTLKCDIYMLGVTAINLFELNESIQNIRDLKSYDNYSTHFSIPELNEKFPKLYKEISIMLSEDPEKRLISCELLNKTNDWTVDPNIIRSDKYFKDFLDICEKDLKIGKNFKFLKTKSKSSPEDDEKRKILKSYVEFKVK